VVCDRFDLDVGLRLQHRFLSGPITGSMIPKPPPSKWDDAEKWIVSPGRKESPTQPHRSLQTLLTGVWFSLIHLSHSLSL
jgi:hypothetical protein